MRRCIETIRKKFFGDKEAETLLSKIKSKNVNVMFLNDKQFKSLNQNNLFHGLVQCFEESGCSSLGDFNAIKKYYKEKAGLITIEYMSPFDDDDKAKIWEAVRSLEGQLSFAGWAMLIFALKGRVVKEQSWGDASKEQARLALDYIIQDMIKSGVNTPKFQKIMEELAQKQFGDYLTV